MSSVKHRGAPVKGVNAAGKHRKYKDVPRLGKGNKWFDLVALLPVAAVLAIVPLIVKMYPYDSGLENFDFYMQSGDTADFFNFHKMVAFLVFSFFMLVLIIAKLCVEKKNIKFSRLFLPLFLYALLVLFSAIGSRFQPYPWTGSFEQFESVFVLLGYVLLAYYAFVFVNKKEDILFLVSALAVSTVFMLALGISQAFFNDFFKSDFGSRLIVPRKYHELVFSDPEGLNFQFPPGHVYLTLYNPNYVGSYVALLAPLFLMMIFASKHVVTKLAYCLLYVGTLWALLGSQSDAGLAGILIALILLVPFFAKFKLKFWLPVILIAAISLGALKVYLVRTDRKGLFEVLKNSAKVPETTYSLTRIDTSGDEVVFTYNENELHVQFMPETALFEVKDQNNLPVDNSFDPETYTVTVTDERFAGATLTPVMFPEGYMGFQAGLVYTWNFALIDGNYVYFTPYGKYMEFINTETVDWLAKYRVFANGRGGIWAKTIPLLKKHIILGSGPDTFVFEYPNYDFLSMLNTGYMNMIVTKPHNMYLQIGVQTGVLSLVAFLAFYLWYFFTCLIVSLKTKKHTLFSMVSGGIAAGTAGYMVAQLINDSSITVAPLYWALIGIGFSACMIAKRENLSIDNPAAV